MPGLDTLAPTEIREQDSTRVEEGRGGDGETPSGQLHR